jgi:hypothetical protein
MPKARRARTWEGAIIGLISEDHEIYMADERKQFPMWIRRAPGEVRVRIVEILPKSCKKKKANK